MPSVINLAILELRNIEASFTPVPEETVTSANPREVRLNFKALFLIWAEFNGGNYE
jgi:hypothetical protein